MSGGNLSGIYHFYLLACMGVTSSSESCMCFWIMTSCIKIIITFTDCTSRASVVSVFRL